MKKLITILLLPACLVVGQNKPRPELPPELKEQADAIKASVEAGEITHEQAKDKLKQLLEDNKPGKKEKTDKPEVDKPETEDKKKPRPELSDELKQKVAELKQKQKALADAHKELRDQLKDVSKEDREELIKQFKEANKEQHAAIKQQAKQIKQEIRESVETGDKRTSDI